MAKVVATMPRRSRYDRFLDGQIWELELGVGCPSSPRIAAISLHAAAKVRGLHVQTRSADGKLYVQAIPPKPTT